MHNWKKREEGRDNSRYFVQKNVCKTNMIHIHWTIHYPSGTKTSDKGDPNHDLLISIYRVTYFISLFPCNSSTKTRVVNKFYEACSLGNLPTREYVCEIDSYCNGRIKACNLRYFETFRWLVFGVFFRIFRKNKEYFSSHLTLRENKSEAQRILCNCSDVWSLAPRWGSTTRDQLDRPWKVVIKSYLRCVVCPMYNMLGHETSINCKSFAFVSHVWVKSWSSALWGNLRSGKYLMTHVVMSLKVQ